MNQILTDFQIYFTVRIRKKFVIILSLKIPSHFKCVATLPCEMSSVLKLGDRAFSVAAPSAWNKLPTELKLLRSTDSFRRDLKTFLLHSVYGHQDTD